MRLDASDLRYMTADEFRVLTSVEMGSKNHEVVPSALIAKIAGLRSGGVNKLLGSLAKRNLIARVQNIKYDGYRLTYGGYDYLAMRALSKRDSVYSVGNKIGVGKESDIYVVADQDGKEMVLKLHRLGRVSFRAIKQKRDYMGKRKSASWMYLSRLSAQKEWAFMKVLHEHGFPVPTPIDQARHCIVMELIDAYPLRQISDVPSPGKLYSQLMDLIVRFAHAGLIHGDFNEFNILIKRTTGEPVVIDFPQMVSTSHENAEWCEELNWIKMTKKYFNRDVECIRRFFQRRFQYESVLYPRFRNTMAEGDEKGDGLRFQLDVVVAASGFSKKDMHSLEEYMETVKDEKRGEDPEQEDEDLELEGSVDEFEDEGGDEEDPDAESPGGDHRPAFAFAHRHTDPAGSSSSLSSDGEQDESDADADMTKNPDSSEPDSDAPGTFDRRSRAPSPTDSLIEHTAALQLEPSQDPGPVPSAEGAPGTAAAEGVGLASSVRNRVAADIGRRQARQTSKYHSKRGVKKIGRPKGSKAKQDLRVKMDRNGVWD